MPNQNAIQRVDQGPLERGSLSTTPSQRMIQKGIQRVAYLPADLPIALSVWVSRGFRELLIYLLKGTLLTQVIH